jgi:predicted GIY-YIG superfamily endonuclease
MKTSVYLITTIDDLMYVGVAKRPKNRLCVHKNSKRFREHPIKTFEILKEFDEYDDALKFETEMVESYETYISGLNLTPHGKGCNHGKFTMLGKHHTEQTRRLIGAKSRKNGNAKNLVRWRENNPEAWTECVSKIQRKGKVHSTKLTSDQVDEILKRFLEWNHVESVQGNGKILSKERAFSKAVSEQFGVTSAAIYNIVTRKTIAWKSNLERILDS